MTPPRPCVGTVRGRQASVTAPRFGCGKDPDSLEKAAEASASDQGGASDTAIEGINLCCKLLVGVLEKEGIKAIDPLGEPFDPSEHQAMSMVENSDLEPNSIAAVVQKGWKLNERLVRPAMVMVVKESETKPPE